MIRFAILTMSIFLFSGCFSKIPETRYYMLDYVPSPTENRVKQGTWPYSLRVRDFTVAEAFRRPQIVYRQNAHQMKFYNFERWAVKPERLITDMVVKHLKTVHLFNNVYRTLDDTRPDLVLSGEVNAIEEYDSDDKWYAHLALDLQLVKPSSGKTIWQHSFDYRKIVNRQEPIYVVRGLSSILESTLDQVISQIDSTLANPALSSAEK